MFKSISDTQTVNTQIGKVMGVNTGSVFRFKGIPYAESPVGELRFSSPKAKKPWEGVRDCTSLVTPSVPQLSSRLFNVMGGMPLLLAEEDSLNLNIWAPACNEKEKLPVLFWIHGGGFSSGSGGWSCYDGEQIAKKLNVVVVTINYRVGTLGLTHLSDISNDFGDGNLWIQDQILALKWVRDNIENFSGDPERITVAGQSAGAYSTLSLMMNKETRDIIHRAMIMSLPTSASKSKDSASITAEKLLSLLKLNKKTAGDLRKLPIEQLLQAQSTLARREAGINQIYPVFAPIIGTESHPEHLNNYTRNEQFCPTQPLLIGTTQDEMMSFIIPGSDDIYTEERIKNDMKASGFFSDEVINQAYEHYKPRCNNYSPLAIFNLAMSDSLFSVDSLSLAQTYAKKEQSAYLYNFNWQPNEKSPLGACHCIDLPFLFNQFEPYKMAPMMEDCDLNEFSKLSQQFVKLVGDFIHGETGSLSANEYNEEIKWPAYSLNDRKVLDITRKMTISDRRYDDKIYGGIQVKI